MNMARLLPRGEKTVFEILLLDEVRDRDFARLKCDPWLDKMGLPKNSDRGL